jgi:hypothetical protein
VVLGDRKLICDPGGEVYTARTFSGQRYESKVLSSFDHAVPVVDRKLQRTGAEARGVVNRRRWQSPTTLPPGTFETALVTWGDWKRVGADTLVITDGGKSLRVEIITGGVPFEVRAETLDEDVRTPKKPVRLGITLKEPVASGQVTLRISPPP